MSLTVRQTLAEQVAMKLVRGKVAIMNETYREMSPESIDEVVLALLSLNVVSEDTAQRPGIQAETHLNPEALERLHAKGYLACEPSTLPDRPVWLTPEGLKRSRELFQQMFKQ